MDSVERSGAPTASGIGATEAVVADEMRTEDAGGAAGQVQTAETRRAARRGERACATCRFWQIGHGISPNGRPYGRCHRRSPFVVKALFDRQLNRVTTETHFPRTPADEWCGEWAMDEDPR